MAQQQTDDFFGMSYIGAQPYGNATTDYLNQLALVHGMLSDQAASQMRTQPAARAQNTQSTQSAASPYAMQGPAQNMQVNNASNLAQGASPYSRTPSAGASQTGQTAVPSYGTPYDYKGTNIPPDMQQLRTNLINFLNASNARTGGQSAPYSLGPGSELFNLGTPLGLNEAYTQANLAPQNIANYLAPGMNTLGGLMNFQAPGLNLSSLYPALNSLLSGQGPQLDLSQIASLGQQGIGSAQQMGQGAIGSAQQYAGLAQSAYGSAMPFAQNIAATGGAPIQQLLQSLGDIRSAGSLGIQNNLAAIREQYGAQGLGAGSDISSALGLGATRGEAELQAQQSSLLTNVLQQAAATQLGGVNALQGIGQGYGGLGQMLAQTQLGAGGLEQNAIQAALQGQLGAQNLNLQAQATGMQGQLSALGQGLNIMQAPSQLALQSAGVQLGAAQALPAYANQMNTAFGQSTQNMLGVAGLAQQGNQYTNQMQYQNFLRQQQLNPQMQASLGMATVYPPVMPQYPGTGTSLGVAGVGAGGSILGALIAAGLLF
jgi:hypothetical protein